MRTTLDLPDALLRQLKARAALEGTTLKSLVRNMVETGLSAPSGAPLVDKPASKVALPSIRLGKPLKLRNLSNAVLFELLDD